MMSRAKPTSESFGNRRYFADAIPIRGKSLLKIELLEVTCKTYSGYRTILMCFIPVEEVCKNPELALFDAHCRGRYDIVLGNREVRELIKRAIYRAIRIYQLCEDQSTSHLCVQS